MFDLWYAVGTAIMEPGLLKKVTDVSATLFTPVSLVYSEERDQQRHVLGNYQTIVGGRLTKAVTNAVREAVATFVKGRFKESAPPISAYTGGKFCQMLTVHSFDFANRITDLHGIYSGLSGHLPTYPSKYFPAFLGVILLDSGLSTAMTYDPASALPADAYREFQITDNTEIAILQAFAAATQDLQRMMLGGGDWDQCREQFDYWDGNNDHMVN